MNSSIVLIIIVISVLGIGFYFLFRSSESDKQYFKNLEKSLEDEFIIDPETGAKLTLEQAQSGNWNPDEVEYYNEEEDPFVSDKHRFFRESVEYYKEELNYKTIELLDSDIELLENINMFTKYKEWFFFEAIAKKEKNVTIGFIAVTLGDIQHSRTNQLFCWIKNLDFSGHYILTKKTKVEENILKLNSIELKRFGSYHCEPIKKTFHEIQLFQLFDKVSEIEELDIEYFEGNLFFKTKREMTKEDITRFEELISMI